MNPVLWVVAAVVAIPFLFVTGLFVWAFAHVARCPGCKDCGGPQQSKEPDWDVPYYVELTWYDMKMVALHMPGFYADVVLLDDMRRDVPKNWEIE